MALTDLGPIYDADGNDITESVLAEAEAGASVSGLRKKFEQGIAETKVEKEARLAAEARVLVLERQNFLRDSGVDLSSEAGKYFAETYNGELTVEAIKEKASMIGLIPKSQDPALVAEVNAMNRIGQAAVTSPVDTSLLSEEEQIAKFQGTPEQFDEFMATRIGSTVDRSQAGAVWDKPSGLAVTTPSPRR